MQEWVSFLLQCKIWEGEEEDEPEAENAYLTGSRV